jgi:hypothetical protein
VSRIATPLWTARTRPSRATEPVTRSTAKLIASGRKPSAQADATSAARTGRTQRTARRPRRHRTGARWRWTR